MVGVGEEVEQEVQRAFMWGPSLGAQSYRALGGDRRGCERACLLPSLSSSKPESCTSGSEPFSMHSPFEHIKELSSQ